MRTVRSLPTLLILLLASVLTMPAHSDEQAQEAIDTRQGLLKMVRLYFGPIVGMARQQIPFDAAVIERNADAISALLPMIPDAFRADTRESGLSSGALDEVWEDWDGFVEKSAAATEAAQALSEAAASGDQGATMKAFGALGGSCKGCHDDYREAD